MGCGSSSPSASAPRVELSAFESLFLSAIQKSKMASFSANGSRVTFSGLLIKFGRMKVGLLRITELFDSLRIKTVHQEKKGCGHIDLQSFKTTGVAQLPYRADSQTTLDKIFSAFATDKKEFINNDELLMLLCIIFMLDGPDSITSNEIVQSLTIFDQSFSCFDVSSDGRVPSYLSIQHTCIYNSYSHLAISLQCSDLLSSA